MKLYTLMLALCLLGYVTPINSIPISKRPTNPNYIQSITTPNFQTSIAPLEINANGTRVIDTQGEYYLTSDIDFHPIAPNDTDQIIIHIQTSNVTLNLNGKQINQDSGNGTANVRAILIDPGLSNIVIHNGSIHNCSGAGIVISENCTNVAIYKVSVINCKLTGIVAGYNPFDTGTYSSVHTGQELIRYVDPATGPTNSSQDIVLDTVSVTGSAGYDTTPIYSHAIGIQLADVKNFQILNTISNSHQYGAPDGTKNSSTNPGGHYYGGAGDPFLARSGYNGYGIQLIRCQNGHIENCESSCNQGYSAYGFLLERCQSINCINCFAHHNTAEGDPIQHNSLIPTDFNFMHHRDLGRAAGFMLHDSSGNVFERCSAYYTSGTRETAGFYARRYVVLASNSSILNSTQFDPRIINQVPHSQLPNKAITIDPSTTLLMPSYIIQDSVIQSFPLNPPFDDDNVTSNCIYLQHSGSNCNTFNECDARHTSSTYLSAHGFLSQGNNNNAFNKVNAQNSTSGIGSESYQNFNTGSLYNFDTAGESAWQLTEHNLRTNPHTGNIIQYATGISLACTHIPLFIWDGTTIQLAEWDTTNNMLALPSGTGELVFLGLEVDSSTSFYPTNLPNLFPGESVFALPCFAESCDSICDSTCQDNFGSCVGAGVGILLDGAYKSRIKKNWLYCNHSCSLGITTPGPCVETGIGALGGYGLLDHATNSTALIMENLAYANQVIKPKQVLSCCAGSSITGTNSCIEGSNYHVTYTNPSLSLPIETASIGDFSPFNILTPFSNFEWECEPINPSYTIKMKYDRAGDAQFAVAEQNASC